MDLYTESQLGDKFNEIWFEDHSDDSNDDMSEAYNDWMEENYEYVGNLSGMSIYKGIGE
jgi:hypothetical protein